MVEVREKYLVVLGTLYCGFVLFNRPGTRGAHQEVMSLPTIPVRFGFWSECIASENPG